LVKTHESDHDPNTTAVSVKPEQCHSSNIDALMYPIWRDTGDYQKLLARSSIVRSQRRIEQRDETSRG
jgi:hypothetical protein